MPADLRFSRQLSLFERRLPRLGGTLRGLVAPGRGWLRLPVAFALILGGLLGFLPVLGFWMLPLGLLLLAIDLPSLRPGVGGSIVRTRHWWRRRATRGQATPPVRIAASPRDRQRRAGSP